MNMHPNWQRRSFDLKNNGPLSRYILIEQIGTPIVEGLTVGGDVAEQQYHGVVLPAVNATTLNSRIGIGAEGELVLKISYQHDAWAFDIGYNLWGRTGESLHCRSSFPDDTYAVKGDAQIYGFDPTPRFVGLNATQTFATIHAGQDDGNANLTFTNANADNHAVAEFQGNALTQSFSPDGIVDTGLTAGTIAAVQGSNQAILLNDCDIDNASALAPAVVSQKIFFHINRSWDNDGTTVPYFGFGGEVELDMGTRRSHGALSQWGFWIKAGIAY
jgi:hypothetical protein